MRSTGADTWRVAGDPAPPEDPRLAAVFGPTEEQRSGAQIAIAMAHLRPGAAPQTRLLAVLRVAEGRVTMHTQPTHQARRIIGALLAGALLAGALLRRARNSR